MASTAPKNPHTHKYTIGDEDAVETLMNKLSQHHRPGPQKLREALETAMDEYEGTDERDRKAFFHGMLTGYGVALQLDAKK